MSFLRVLAQESGSLYYDIPKFMSLSLILEIVLAGFNDLFLLESIG